MAETTTTPTEEAPQEVVQDQVQQEEAPPENQEPQTNLDDPMLSQLWDDLGIKSDTEPEQTNAGETQQEDGVQPEEPKAEESKTEESEGEATKEEPEPEVEEEPKKEFSVKPKLDEEAFRKVVREELEARGKTPEPDPQPKKEEPVDTYEDELIDEQKEELELYRYAESKGKHKGKASKLLDFYKELDGYVEKARREDPERTFDNEDSEFMDFVRRNKPVIKSSDIDSIKRDKFRDEIVSDVKKEYESTINGLKGELNEIRATPQVKATIKEAGRAYDEFAKLEDMKEADPLKHNIFSQEREKYITWADDFVKRWHGLNTQTDDGYYKLINDIETEAETYARTGNTDKDGQKFLTPSRYAQAQDKQGYWTWDQNDILEHFGTKAIQLANENVDKRVKELESYGFVRGVKPGESKKSANDPQPVNPPKASRSPSPGVAEGASVQDNHMGKDLINELGIDFG